MFIKHTTQQMSGYLYLHYQPKRNGIYLESTINSYVNNIILPYFVI